MQPKNAVKLRWNTDRKLEIFCNIFESITTPGNDFLTNWRRRCRDDGAFSRMLEKRRRLLMKLILFIMR